MTFLGYEYNEHGQLMIPEEDWTMLHLTPWQLGFLQSLIRKSTPKGYDEKHFAGCLTALKVGDRKMRVNVYSQELTGEVNLIQKESNTGLTYSAVQLMLHSSEKLHHPPLDDDRSAVTFWLPKSASRRAELAKALEEMAAMVLSAPPETGLD